MQAIELLHDLDDFVVKFHQSWNDRLDFPPTKICERYLRNQLAVALELVCNVGGRKVGMLALIRFKNAVDAFGNFSRPRRHTQHQFSVLIDNVEALDDGQRATERVGGVVWLEAFDEIEHLSVCDSLYFSLVKGNSVFVDRPFLENRELDLPRVLYPVDVGEYPRNMIKAGSQVMHDLPGQHTEPQWNDAVLMILNSLKEQLVVVLGQDGVLAFLKKPGDFRLQIEDVLVGPF